MNIVSPRLWAIGWIHGTVLCDVCVQMAFLACIGPPLCEYWGSIIVLSLFFGWQTAQSYEEKAKTAVQEEHRVIENADALTRRSTELNNFFNNGPLQQFMAPLLTDSVTSALLMRVESRLTKMKDEAKRAADTQALDALAAEVYI